MNRFAIVTMAGAAAVLLGLSPAMAFGGGSVEAHSFADQDVGTAPILQTGRSVGFEGAGQARSGFGVGGFYGDGFGDGLGSDGSGYGFSCDQFKLDAGRCNERF